MNSRVNRISFKITVNNPEQQILVKEILGDLKRDFPISRIETKVEDERLTPYEIGLLIVIGFVSNVSSEILIRFLEKLWTKLGQSGVSPDLGSVDRVQLRAESYLARIGVASFNLVRRDEKGMFVIFSFEDSAGGLHDLHVSKTDSQILRYERREH